MWTTLAVLAIISGLGVMAWWYVRDDARKEADVANSAALAKQEQDRREFAEAAAIEESKKRTEEFNEKSATVHDAAGAADLLKTAAGHTSNRPVQPKP